MIASKYEIIMNDIQKKIAAGYYLTGDKLPSIKKMALFYQCAPETINKVYKELIQRHVLYAKKGSGHYVTQAMAPLKKSETLMDLSTGNIEISEFPLIESKANLLTGIELYKQQTLKYSLNGVGSLVEALIHYLQDSNLFVNPASLYVNQGVHQAFVAITQSNIRQDKEVILIENPTYSFTIDYLKKHDFKVATILRTADGFDLNALELLFKTNTIRFFYLTPRNHNPLGTTLSKKMIRKIAKLAEKYDVLLIENDYFSEGQYQHSYETLVEHTRTHCFYLSSFTKILPHLRTGFMLIPTSYIEQWRQVVQDYYLDGYFAPSLVAQSALDVMLRNHTLLRYKKNLYQQTQKKRRLVYDISQEWDSSLLQTLPSVGNGYYFSLQVAPSISIDTLCQTLKQHQILVSSLAKSYYHPTLPHSHGIRISVSQISRSDLKKTLQIIYDCCLQLQEKSQKRPY